MINLWQEDSPYWALSSSLKIKLKLRNDVYKVWWCLHPRVLHGTDSSSLRCYGDSVFEEFSLLQIQVSFSETHNRFDVTYRKADRDNKAHSCTNIYRNKDFL